MELNSPDTWRWVWFTFAIVFLLGELISPAAFFILPFAAGAFVAGVAASLGLGIPGEWIVFIGVSALAFAGLWPLGRRLDRTDTEQEGVGATRWVGQQAQVVEEIPPHGVGTVRLEREVWRAESFTGDSIRKGSIVLITKMAGTRLVVIPVDDPIGSPGLGSTDFDAGLPMNSGRDDPWPQQGDK